MINIGEIIFERIYQNMEIAVEMIFFYSLKLKIIFNYYV